MGHLHALAERQYLSPTLKPSSPPPSPGRVMNLSPKQRAAALAVGKLDSSANRGWRTCSSAPDICKDDQEADGDEVEARLCRERDKDGNDSPIAGNAHSPNALQERPSSAKVEVYRREVFPK